MRLLDHSVLLQHRDRPDVIDAGDDTDPAGRARTNSPPATFDESPEAPSTSPRRHRIFGQKDVARYIAADNADVYQRILRLFYENKRVLGPRLTEDVIAARLWSDFGFEIDDDRLVRHLDQLVTWGNLDRQHDAGHARNLDEFKRRRHNYAITQAGELFERALDDLDNLRERIGALEGSRLQAILEELAAIVREVESGRPEPQRLRTALDNLRGELEALDQGASDFMAQLANALASSEAINDDNFLAYKDRVITYLTGFASDFRRSAQRIEDQILRVEELGVEAMIALAASVDEPPMLGRSPEEIAEIRRAEKRDSWRALSAWFVAAGGDAAPWRKLSDTLGVAIDWVVTTATRLDARRTQRIDRSAEYRHLAQLALRLDAGENHRVFNAVFALGSPRHFYGIQDDERHAEQPQTAWADGPEAPIEASLYRAGGRTGGAGLTARLIDTSGREAAFAEQCAREQAELEQALARFRSDGGPVTLSALASLEASEFRHLLAWLDRALVAPCDADGAVRALSPDGLFELTLTPPADPAARARITTPEGVFEGPDYALEVVER